MKKIIVLIMMVFLGNLSSTVYSSSRGTINYYKFEPIDNGWYKASVKYYNSSTYTRSNYTLNVKVEYNSVTAIDFGDGGSVHSGFNNSNYTYSGGSLFFNKNYNGEITSATTSVIVRYNNGTTVTFDIEL